MSVIDRIRAAGVELKADGDRLLVRGDMTAAQRPWLREPKADVVRELRRSSRPIVNYQYADDEIGHVMLGRDGETFEEAAAACHRRFGAVLTRERETVPAGFPFKRRGDEGEWKDERGDDLDGPEAA